MYNYSSNKYSHPPPPTTLEITNITINLHQLPANYRELPVFTIFYGIYRESVKFHK